MRINQYVHYTINESVFPTVMNQLKFILFEKNFMIERLHNDNVAYVFTHKHDKCMHIGFNIIEYGFRQFENENSKIIQYITLELYHTDVSDDRNLDHRNMITLIDNILKLYASKTVFFHNFMYHHKSTRDELFDAIDTFFNNIGELFIDNGDTEDNPIDDTTPQINSIHTNESINKLPIEDEIFNMVPIRVAVTSPQHARISNIRKGFAYTSIEISRNNICVIDMVRDDIVLDEIIFNSIHSGCVIVKSTYTSNTDIFPVKHRSINHIFEKSIIKYMNTK